MFIFLVSTMQKLSIDTGVKASDVNDF